MNGIWILLLLTSAAVLPAIIVFLWYRRGKSVVTPPWFLASFAAGIISLSIAALIQSFFRTGRGGQDGLWQLFFNVFVRIALVEEASRIITLFFIFKIGKRRLHTDKTFGPALGLAAGLGFAALENAFYGMADINITLLRSFTAALLHGACGIRAGTAVSVIGERPLRALSLFISTVIIHGTYNLIIISPPVPSVLAIPIALAAFFASLYLLKSNGNAEL